jgi:hypothetical protein
MSNKLPSSESVLSTVTEVFESDCTLGLYFLTVIELDVLATRFKKRLSDNI